MAIDVKTLILFTGICHLMQFLVLYQQYRTNENIFGTGWWLLWSIAEVFGFIVMLLRGIPALLPVIIIVQNSLFLAGTVFVYFGIMRFYNKKINYKLIIPVFLSYVTLHLFFYLVKDNISMRTLIFDAAISIVGFLNAYTLSKNKTRSSASTANFIALIFVVHALIFAYRTVMIISGTPVTEVFAQTFFNITQYFDALIVGLLWTFGFIILLNQKLISENAELKTQFEEIFHISPDAALITRLSDGLFFDCNDGYTKFSGYSKSEMISKTVPGINLWKDTDDRAEVIKIIEEKGFCENYEALFQRKDGETVTGLLSAKNITLREVPYIISITRDISEIKAAQEKEQNYLSELKELNAIKDKLFSIIGHDLRSPFTAILGFTELLKQNLRKDSPETIEMYVDYIQQSSEHTYKLLENLLNWAKTQTGQIKINLIKLEINSIIQDIINLTMAQTVAKKISLEFHQIPITPILSDENIVNTVLRNLITNAIKFTNSNGSIIIKTMDKTDFIEVSVTDNGIGMPDEIKNKLFKELISQTREGTNNERGTGLGLAISKEFIERLGGKIWFESEAGKGSTFSFSLPKEAL
jgi:PAS domain S-box-containing protein